MLGQQAAAHLVIARDSPLTLPLLERVRTAPRFIHTNPFSVRVEVRLGIISFDAELPGC